MPELPEVETTRRGIAPHIEGQTIDHVVVRQSKLRWPIPDDLNQHIAACKITAVARRAKYLLIHLPHGVIMVHLGMSGSLRVVQNDIAPQKHDHVDWVFATHTLRYHDPRRFGAVLWHDLADGDWQAHPRLRGLGIEPFDARFDGAYIYQVTRSIKQAIKVSLLSGKWVVGVGNIYASEVLFLCGIHPEKPACALTRAECRKLAQHIPALLKSAIERGGSTLKDFVNSDGNTGYFQMNFNVYDRADQPCVRCKTPITRIVQAQRATYFCAQCQK